MADGLAFSFVEAEVLCAVRIRSRFMQETHLVTVMVAYPANNIRLSFFELEEFFLCVSR